MEGFAVCAPTTGARSESYLPDGSGSASVSHSVSKILPFTGKVTVVNLEVARVAGGILHQFRYLKKDFVMLFSSKPSRSLILVCPRADTFNE